MPEKDFPKKSRVGGYQIKIARMKSAIRQNNDARTAYQPGIVTARGVSILQANLT
jgi:hypothetical protein